MIAVTPAPNVWRRLLVVSIAADDPPADSSPRCKETNRQSKQPDDRQRGVVCPRGGSHYPALSRRSQTWGQQYGSRLSLKAN